MELRKATINDLKIIQELNHKLFIHDADCDSSLDMNWSFSKDGEEFYRKYITNKDCRAFVIEDEKKNIIAYIVADIREDLFFNKDENKIIVIEDTYIEEKYRKQGLGKKLFNEVEKFAKENKVKKMKVCVYDKNKSALGFYHNIGFEDFSINLEKDLQS